MCNIFAKPFNHTPRGGYSFLTNRKTFLGVILALLFVSSNALGLDKVSTGIFSNVAVKGYDTVAYFTQGEAVKGSKDFSHDYNGATWRFSTQEHLDLFKSDSEKYAPQYGGYCAYAISQNTTAPIDPKLFTIVDDKLYLNYNKKVNNLWNEDRPAYIKSADTHWQELTK